MSHFLCWRLHRGPHAVGYCESHEALVVVVGLAYTTVYLGIQALAWETLCLSLTPFEAVSRITGHRKPARVSVGRSHQMSADRFVLEFDHRPDGRLIARAM